MQHNGVNFVDAVPPSMRKHDPEDRATISALRTLVDAYRAEHNDRAEAIIHRSCRCDLCLKVMP